jgi:hypothetical protein
MRNSSVSVRGLIGLSLGIAVALSAPLAVAKGKKAGSSAKKHNEKKKVLIGAFDGPKSDQARKAVIAALKDDGEYDVSDSTDAKPGGDDKSYAKASGGAAAVIVGTVKKGTGLVLSVHNGADGALIQDVEIKGDSAAKLSKSIDATLAVSVADAVAQTKAGADSSDDAAPTDKDEKSAKSDKGDEKKDDKEDKDADDEKSDKPAAASAATDEPEGPSPIDVTAGLRAVHRSFTYHDTPAQLYPANGYPSPLTYLLPLGPAAFIDGTIYPVAFASSGAAGNIGITGGYEIGFATRSVYTGASGTPQTLTTRSSQYDIGLRGRIPVSVHEFGLIAAFGQQVFNLLGDEASPLVPDVSYKFIRLGADARLRFDELTFGFHIGTRLVSNTGGLQADWFPNTKTQSIEAGILAGYTLTHHVDLVGGVDLLRYAFDFNPIPNNADPNTKAIAGGAVDQYVSGYLGIRYTMPNSNHN